MQKRNPRWVLALLLTVITGLAAPPSFATDEPETIAAEAFELRLAGRVDEAVEMLVAGLADAPDSGILHYELARARLLLLDIPGMHQEARAAVEHAPGDTGFLYFAAMGAAYAVIDAGHHGDRDRMKALGQESLDHLRAILAIDADHHLARWFLVQLSTEMAAELGVEVEDPEIHVAVLEAKDPVLGAKARCCLVDETRQGEIWRKILADHPDDGRALSEAAAGLIQAGDLDLAEECLDRAIAKDRGKTYGLLGLGLAYAMREDWDRAKALTQRYLDTDPPLALRAFAIGRLGMIHHRAGDAGRGKELMEEARRLDPHVWPTVMPPPEEIFTPF